MPAFNTTEAGLDDLPGTVTSGCRGGVIEGSDIVRHPRDLASHMAGRQLNEGYLRKTFTLPRAEARARASHFKLVSQAVCVSTVESWRDVARRRYRIHDLAAVQCGLETTKAL
jgi:hypothetical protein